MPIRRPPFTQRWSVCRRSAERLRSVAIVSWVRKALAAVLRLLLYAAGVLAFVQSLATGIRWVQGDLASPSLEDWFWLALLPPMLLLYLRVSVFGCREPACLLPPEPRSGKASKHVGTDGDVGQ